MSKTAKYLVSALVVLLFLLIFVPIVGIRSDNGQTPGILGLLVFAGLIGALRAIWKSKSNNEDSNNTSLQK